MEADLREKVWKKCKKLAKARKCTGPTRPAASIVKPDRRPDPSSHFHNPTRARKTRLEAIPKRNQIRNFPRMLANLKIGCASFCRRQIAVGQIAVAILQ